MQNENQEKRIDCLKVKAHICAARCMFVCCYRYVCMRVCMYVYVCLSLFDGMPCLD
jgi:hypothetical protein